MEGMQTLYVLVEQAHGLSRRHGAPNPCVWIKGCDGQKARTKVLRGTHMPLWNDVLTVNIAISRTRVTVNVEHREGEEEEEAESHELGRCAFSLLGLQGYSQKWLQLEGEGGQGKVRVSYSLDRQAVLQLQRGLVPETKRVEGGFSIHETQWPANRSEGFLEGFASESFESCAEPRDEGASVDGQQPAQFQISLESLAPRLQPESAAGGEARREGGWQGAQQNLVHILAGNNQSSGASGRSLDMLPRSCAASMGSAGGGELVGMMQS